MQNTTGRNELMRLSNDHFNKATSVDSYIVSRNVVLAALVLMFAPVGKACCSQTIETTETPFGASLVGEMKKCYDSYTDSG